MSRSIMKPLSLASIVVMSLVLSAQAMAAVDMFIKFDEVEGESMDSTHRGWIDVLAWSWGLNTDGKGKTCVQNISLTKWIDSATDDLAQSMPANTTFSQAQLVVRKAGQSQNTFLVYDMTGVKITSLSTGGSGGEDRFTENVSFEFAELKGTYTPQTSNGGEGTPQEFLIPGGKCK